MFQVKVRCQVKITVDSLFISHIVDTLGFSEEDYITIFDDSYEHGPFVYLEVHFDNFEKDTLYLVSPHPDIREWGVYISYAYKSKNYLIPANIDREQVLLPNTSKTISLRNYIFLGTDIKYQGGGVYYKQVIESLPTLQILFMTKSGYIYTSCGIKNVEYKE